MTMRHERRQDNNGWFISGATFNALSLITIWCDYYEFPNNFYQSICTIAFLY